VKREFSPLNSLFTIQNQLENLTKSWKRKSLNNF